MNFSNHFSLFSLRCTRDAGFRFRAGQFVRLGVRKASGCIVWRAYSVVSAPHDDYLEFFSIVVPGGEFTSELSRLRSGDELLVEKQATGFLTLDRFPDGRDLWLIGTGTGLAPFLSILQDLEAWQRFERIVLVYSARDRGELAYQELIAELPPRFCGMEVLKFQQLVRPGDRIQLSLRFDAERGKLYFAYRNGDAPCSSGRILLGAADA